MKRCALAIAALSFSLVLCGGDGTSSTDAAKSWSPKSAAAYLDSRMDWWSTWSNSQRDQGTFCVSCHTSLPYALSRPALRSPLGEREPSPTERKLVDNVLKRVRLWSETKPYYSDEKNGAPKTSESRGTEAVLNALVLSRYASNPADLDAALANMWSMQIASGDQKGAFPWLEFHNSPWEGHSQFLGATFAALAASAAPTSTRKPDFDAHLALLRDYLTRDQASQILINRVMLVWASAKLPGLLTPADQHAILDAAFAKQKPDGGFSLSAFVGDWQRADHTPLETQSDGYATGVVALAAEQAGTTAADPRLKRALAWLDRNQNKEDGRWLAYSLNKQRNLSSDVGRFMSDAATSFAVMALEHSN